MVFAGKATPIKVQAGGEAVATAAAVPVKAKAKKVPRYVKEALMEVEKEKATKLAAGKKEQQPLQASGGNKPAKALKQQAAGQKVKANKPVKTSKLKG